MLNCHLWEFDARTTLIPWKSPQCHPSGEVLLLFSHCLQKPTLPPSAWGKTRRQQTTGLVGKSGSLATRDVNLHLFSLSPPFHCFMLSDSISTKTQLPAGRRLTALSGEEDPGV